MPENDPYSLESLGRIEALLGQRKLSLEASGQFTPDVQREYGDLLFKLKGLKFDAVRQPLAEANYAKSGQGLFDQGPTTTGFADPGYQLPPSQPGFLGGAERALRRFGSTLVGDVVPALGEMASGQTFTRPAIQALTGIAPPSSMDPMRDFAATRVDPGPEPEGTSYAAHIATEALPAAAAYMVPIFGGAGAGSKLATSGAGALSEAALTALGRRGAMGGAAAVGGALQGSQMQREAEAAGAEPAVQIAAGVAGTGLGLSEALLFGGGASAGGPVRRAVAGALIETPQEVGQQIASDAVAKALYDPNRELLNQGTLDAAIVAPIIGGTMGAMNAPAAALGEKKGPVAEAAEKAKEQRVVEGVRVEAQAAEQQEQAQVQAQYEDALSQIPDEELDALVPEIFPPEEVESPVFQAALNARRDASARVAVEDQQQKAAEQQQFSMDIDDAFLAAKAGDKAAINYIAGEGQRSLGIIQDPNAPPEDKERARKFMGRTVHSMKTVADFVRRAGTAKAKEAARAEKDRLAAEKAMAAQVAQEPQAAPFELTEEDIIQAQLAAQEAQDGPLDLDIPAPPEAVAATPLPADIPPDIPPPIPQQPAPVAAAAPSPGEPLADRPLARGARVRLPDGRSGVVANVMGNGRLEVSLVNDDRVPTIVQADADTLTRYLPNENETEQAPAPDSKDTPVGEGKYQYRDTTGQLRRTKVSPETMRQIIADAAKAAKLKVEFQPELWASDDTPAARAAMAAHGRKGTIELRGKWQPRLIEISLSQSAPEAIRAARHEIGHEILNLMEPHERVAAIDDLGMLVPREGAQNKAQRKAHLEEVFADKLADWWEGNFQPRPALLKVFQKIRAFIDALGDMLRKAGFEGFGDFFSDAAESAQRRTDVRMQEVVEGKYAGRSKKKPTSQEIAFDTKAHHGSPHDFDKFELSDKTIGTGEGAQAYGHGLYFAGDEAVARHYRDRLGDVALPDGFNLRGEALKIIAELGLDPNDVTMSELMDFQDEAIRRHGKPKGKLYKVSLKPEADEWLDWDKPLSEQSEKVKKALGLEDETELRSELAQLNKTLLEQETRYANGDESALKDPSRRAISKRADEIAIKLNSLYNRKWSGGDFYKTKAHSMQSAAAASKALHAAGIPGIRYLDGSSRSKGEGSHNYVVFDDSLITIEEKYLPKAQANSPTKPLSPRQQAIVAAVKARIAARTTPPTPPSPAAPQPSSTWTAREESWITGKRRTIQDRYLWLRHHQEDIKKAGRQLTEDQQAYEKEEFLNGKFAYKYDKFVEDEVETLAKVMAANKVTAEEAGVYLHARYAPERNAYVRSIDPTNNAGSGMTDAEAAQVMADVARQGRQKQFDAVAAEVDKIVQGTRDVIRNAGLESDDQVDAWMQDKFYVPLKGFADTKKKGEAAGNRGKGLSVKGREARLVLGRASSPENPLLNAIDERSRVLLRAEKTEVIRALGEEAMAHPNPDVWEVFTEDAPDTKRQLKVWWEDAAGKKYPKFAPGLVRHATVGNAPVDMSSDDYIGYKVKGKRHYIKFKDKRAAQAVLNAGPYELGKMHSYLHRAMGYLAAMSTRMNPPFIVMNAIRDLQTVNMTVAAETSDGGKLDGKSATKLMAGITGNWFARMKDAARGLAGRPIKDPQIDAYWKEFQSGGAMSAFVHPKSIEEMKDAVKLLVASASGSKLAKVATGLGAAGRLMNYLNGVVENATRFSVYVESRKAGLSQHAASSMAKNSSLNFNRRGEAGPLISSLWLFANPNIQGIQMLGHVAKSKVGRRMFYSLATIGVLAALRNAAVSDDDEDGRSFYSKIPDWEKSRNFIWMDEDGKGYTKIPAPYGLNLPFVLAGAFTEAATGEISKEQAAMRAADAMIGTFAPTGVSEGSTWYKTIAKSVSPTAVKPLLELGMNENYFGAPIHPKELGVGTTKPRSEQSFRGTAPWFREAAQWLNSVAGGNEHESSRLDMYPDTIEHFAQFAAGGVGKFANDLAYAVSDNKDTEASKTPFVSRIRGEAKSFSDLDRYYDRRDKIGQKTARSRELKGVERVEYTTENAAWLSLSPMLKGTEKQIRGIRERRAALEAKIPSTISESIRRDEEIIKLDSEIETLIKRFNRAFDEKVGKFE